MRGLYSPEFTMTELGVFTTYCLYRSAQKLEAHDEGNADTNARCEADNAACERRGCYGDPLVPNQAATRVPQSLEKKLHPDEKGQSRRCYGRDIG
jgi:hypothetical protein